MKRVIDLLCLHRALQEAHARAQAAEAAVFRAAPLPDSTFVAEHIATVAPRPVTIAIDAPMRCVCLPHARTTITLLLVIVLPVVVQKYKEYTSSTS